MQELKLQNNHVVFLGLLGGAISACSVETAPLAIAPNATDKSSGDRIALIFQDDLTEVTLFDIGIAHAVLNLPNSEEVNALIQDRAAHLLLEPHNPPKEDSLLSRTVVPTDIDFAEPIDSLDLLDIAVMLGALNTDNRSTQNLAERANQVVMVSLSSDRIHDVPGGFPSVRQLIDTGACESCDLSSAYLVNADLSNTNLAEADLTGANLNGANLNEANLTNADLSDVSLQDSTFTNVNVTGATLNNLVLQGADVSGTDFNAAGDLSGLQLPN
ncbi:MAG: pentapeptide repeat-containing protein [Cyanobacteria bacterium J06642_2]